MMNCPEFETILVEFLDDRLSESVAAGARAHLESCPACRRSVELHRRAWERVGDLESIEPEATFVTSVRRRLRRSRLSRIVGSLAAAAAAVVVALAVRGRAPAPPDEIELALGRMASEDRRLLEELARDRTWELADNMEVIKALELLDRDDAPSVPEEGH